MRKVGGSGTAAVGLAAVVASVDVPDPHGPANGGRIVFEGTPADLVAARFTLTGKHLATYIGTSARAG